MAKEKMSDVIVLLPGITGSVLRQGDEDVWGWSVKAGLRALFSRGSHLTRKLALRDDNDPEREILDDGVTADRVISDLHLIPDLWKVDRYTKIADSIKRDFDVQPMQNYFELPYDWRRDNRAAAWKLKRRAHDWLKAWRSASGNNKAKLILVGHSMGGLVSRYFLECLDGWKDTKALITFGTPYRGSLNAVNTLANGERVGPFGVLDLTPLTSTLTSVYQLLPIYPAYDAGDNNGLQRIGEVRGIPGIDPQRAADALKFHHEIKQAVEAHQQDAAYRDNGYQILPVVGTHQPTNQSARFDGTRVIMQESYRGEDQSGDGTVPFVSATPIEYKDIPMYAATRHGSLQNADPVLVQLYGFLSSLSIDFGFFRKGDTTPRAAHISLGVDDLYWEGQPIVVRAKADQEGTALFATLVNADTGAEVARRPLVGNAEGWQQGEFAPVSAGFYRVVVRSGDQSVTPVADIFEVVDEKTLEE